MDALKGNSLHVAGLPKILQLHLLRFRFDWQTERMSKIHHAVEFPLVRVMFCCCVIVISLHFSKIHLFLFYVGFRFVSFV